MKKTLLTLALAGTFGVVSAQSLSTGMQATKPVVNTSGVALKATPAVLTPQSTNSGMTDTAKVDPHVNPFNGKLQSAEQIQRELEQTRVETQMLEERLKQTNLSEELKTVPLRKAVEAAQAATAVKKEESNQKDLDAAMRAPKIPTGMAAHAAQLPAVPKAVAVKKTARPAKAKASATETFTEQSANAIKPAPAQVARPTLVSVMELGSSRSAVLDFAGSTLVVSDGDSTPFGVLKIKNKDSVELGGTALRVHNATMARFVVSDAKAVMVPGSNNAMGGAAAVATPIASPVSVSPATLSAPSAVGLPAQANGPLPALPLPPSTAAVAAPLNTTMVPGSGVKSSMPSLQLPPGVTMLPASN